MTRTARSMGEVEKEDFCISYSRDRFLCWPAIGGAYHFADGELVVNYFSAKCDYEHLADLRHQRIEGHSEMVSARSLDGGHTWPEDQQTTFFDYRSTFSELEAGERLDVDMRQPDSILFCFHTSDWEGVAMGRAKRCFMVRSPARGRTWDTRPIWIDLPYASAVKAFGTFLRRSDGVILVPAQVATATGEYECILLASLDGGEVWNYYSRMVGPSTLPGVHHQPFLVEFPNGRLLATIRHQGAPVAIAWTLVTESDDGGLTWSEPRRINEYGAPGPIALLPDGRVVVVYGYRHPPFGVRGKVSEDRGRTWSDEFVLQDRGASWDLGYPRVASMDDGRVFAAYYFNEREDDVDLEGGRRHIRGCIFKVR